MTEESKEEAVAEVVAATHTDLTPEIVVPIRSRLNFDKIAEISAANQPWWKFKTSSMLERLLTVMKNFDEDMIVSVWNGYFKPREPALVVAFGNCTPGRYVSFYECMNMFNLPVIREYITNVISKWGFTVSFDKLVFRPFGKSPYYLRHMKDSQITTCITMLLKSSSSLETRVEMHAVLCRAVVSFEKKHIRFQEIRSRFCRMTHDA
jgi:hypothetical protein